MRDFTLVAGQPGTFGVTRDVDRLFAVPAARPCSFKGIA